MQTRTRPSSSVFQQDLAGVVAIEPAGPFIRVFVRNGTEVTFHDYPFEPFLFIKTPDLVAGLAIPTSCRQLHGTGDLCWLAHTTTWHDWCQLREHLQQTSSRSEWYAIGDIRQQFLITTGIRFFRDLSSHDIHVLCLAATTNDDTDCAQPGINVALSDGAGYEQLLSSTTTDVQTVLKQLSRIIREKDPDVITGYGLARHTLPLLLKQAAVHGVKLSWGRNGSTLHVAEQRTHAARYELFGRSLIDSSNLIRQYDRLLQPLGGTDLHQAASWLDCVPQSDSVTPALVLDNRAAIKLYQLLIPAWYCLAQTLPVTLQNALVLPGSSAINAWLIQEYLAKDHALPGLPEQHHPATPDIGQVFQQGKVGPVAHCDLTSLRSSILQAYRIAPAHDELGQFLSLLARASTICLPPADSISADLLTRLLLPLFHELLVRHHPFSDAAAAQELDRLYKVIIHDILHWLRDQGAIPVALDHQGLYFVPPPGHDGNEELCSLMQHLATILPRCSTLQCDARYQAMFSHKPNSFALLHESGAVVFRDSTATSRSMEPYLREFLTEAITLLLQDKTGEVRTLYESFLKRLVSHACPVQWVTRTETLTDSPDQYQQAVNSGKRKHAAVYELACTTPGRWQAGDSISYYVTGNTKQVAIHDHCKLISEFDPLHPDINVPWYAERLHLLYQRIAVLMPPEPTLFG